MEKRIDATDMKIIRLLQQNGRMSNTDIAKKAGVSETTVRYRMQRLTKEDYIQIVAMVKPVKLGFGIEGSCLLSQEVVGVHDQSLGVRKRVAWATRIYLKRYRPILHRRLVVFTIRMLLPKPFGLRQRNVGSFPFPVASLLSRNQDLWQGQLPDC